MPSPSAVSIPLSAVTVFDHDRPILHPNYQTRLPVSGITVLDAVLEITAYTRILHLLDRDTDKALMRMAGHAIRADRRSLIEELVALGFCADLACTHCYPIRCANCGVV